MKKHFYKFAHPSVFIPLLLFLGFLFALYHLVLITITEPASAFNSGKAPMYVVILIFALAAVYLLSMTIRSFKKLDSYAKRYTKEEKEKLLQINEAKNLKNVKLTIHFPLAVTFTLFGCLFLLGGFLNRNSAEPGFVFFFFIMGVVFLTVGIFMFIKVFKKNG